MYKKPLLTLLSDNSTSKRVDKRTVDALGERICLCLQSLKASVALVGSTVSPVNIVFDFKLSKETQLKTIENLTDDISLAVGSPVKIFNRGLESLVFSVSVSRRDRDYFGIREMLSSEEYKTSKSPLLKLSCLA